MGEHTRPRPQVMLVEDNAAVRRALAALLVATGDLDVCAEAATVAEAGPAAGVAEPQVVVVDLCLPDGSGVQAARDVRAASRNTHVLLLTSASEETALVASVLAAARGYVIKQLLGQDLVAAVRTVAAGMTLIEPSVRAAVVARLQDRISTASGLDARILAEVVDGRTDDEIGLALNLEQTVVRRKVASIVSGVGGGGSRSRPARTPGARFLTV